MRRALLWCAAAVFISASVLSISLPHLLPLLREGFPSPQWPAPGQFQTVKGAAQPSPLVQPPAIPPAARDRFVASGGRALLVERGGRVVAASYGQGIEAEDRFNSYSLVKSLVGVLAIRALADGRIASLDDSLRMYLGPEAPDASIRQVLTMTSGLLSDGEPAKSMDDGGFSPFGPLAELHVFGLAHSLPSLAVDPASQGQFSYQSVNTALLGAVLETVYDVPLSDLLSRMIWAPAGAGDADWRRYPKGAGVSAYCCLYARPVDWIRVGRYLLNNGTEDAAFLPGDLWQQWILPPDLSPEARRAGAYGWHLRHDVLDRDGAKLQGQFAYFFGHQGQLLYLLPDTDVVAARFGDQMPLLHSTLYELFPDG